jgi:hypothetical protein
LPETQRAETEAAQTSSNCERIRGEFRALSLGKTTVRRIAQFMQKHFSARKNSGSLGRL